jgi:uncharacterized membrane protein
VSQDLLFTFQWGFTIFLVGLAALPYAHRLFSKWWDGGYLWAKSLGLIMLTYLIYILGVAHIAPFTFVTVLIALLAIFGIGLHFFPIKHLKIKTWMWEESFFLICLFFWSWIKAHEPSIHGLEKFMDFGFAKSILNSAYFPAPDMWFAGKFYINYYYFGHTAMAVLTRLSGIDLVYTFNLMLAALFAFTATLSFSIIYQLIKSLPISLLTAYLVTLGANLQTIYAFTTGYNGEEAPPLFWNIWTGKLSASYWYANATRFIPYTIHEFPSYSFVVSDIHGHVLSLPFVLLAIGLITEMFWNKQKQWWMYAVYGFIASVLLMTNALDGPIYMGLLFIMLLLTKSFDKQTIKYFLLTCGVAVLASLPFLHYFKSFVSGLAVNCPPAALANTKYGPLLFEGVEKCQKSPLWMMAILWGFFLFCGIWLFAKYKVKDHLLIFGLFTFSVLLIIFPEFFYFKDIYPMHFRSNTMFKLGYQAFIMFGLVSGYAIYHIKDKLFRIILIPLILLVMIFPWFSVRSYFGELKTYIGLDGSKWLAEQYPDDFAAIDWINSNADPSAVIVEADGDSYTDYERFSTFTGHQTIAGWAVHEWLWRGSYDIIAPRREEVRQIYESPDIELTKDILDKYQVSYVIIGTLERQKFTQLQETKFIKLGRVAFSSGTTVIYSILRPQN